jgi:hypothetical protein
MLVNALTDRVLQANINGDSPHPTGLPGPHMGASQLGRMPNLGWSGTSLGVVPEAPRRCFGNALLKKPWHARVQ